MTFAIVWAVGMFHFVHFFPHLLPTNYYLGSQVTTDDGLQRETSIARTGCETLVLIRRSLGVAGMMSEDPWRPGDLPLSYK